MVDLARRPSASPLAKDHPARRLVDAFLKGRNENTLRAYRKDLEDFARFTRTPGVEEATEKLLKLPPGRANELALAYRTDLVERKLQPSTVNRRLASLRAFVKLARMLGMVTWSIEVENLSSDPYRDTRGPGTSIIRQMLVKLAEREDAKGIRDYAIVRLLHDLALRRGEVVSLDVEHVALQRNGVDALSILGKGKKARQWVTMTTPLRAALVAWLDVRGDEPGPLFTALDTQFFGHRLTGSAVYAIIRGLGLDLGVKTRPHGLRHTAITSALDKTGGNTREVQKFSRHADQRTLGLYDDARRDMAGEIAEMVSDLDAPEGGKVS
jgi:integrase/recombinase XerC